MKNHLRQPGERHPRSLTLTVVILLVLVLGLLIFWQRRRETPPVGNGLTQESLVPAARVRTRSGEGPVKPAAPDPDPATTANAEVLIIESFSASQGVITVWKSGVAPTVLLPAQPAKPAAPTGTISPANRTRIKLGTLAPVGTSYHKTLMTMGETWRKETGGTVELTVDAGGKLGGEAEMVGLMKANSLQAAMLTAVGLAEIEPAVTGLQNIPMGFRNFDEVDYVGLKLQPMLEERMEKKGFVVLFWTDAGWVRFFSNKPVTHPGDLKKLRLFTWAGAPARVEIYQSAGFNPVPRETADLVPGLQTGLIDAVPVPPFFTMAAQIDTRAPFMLELNWSPFVGACVVRKETWYQLPAETRAELLKAAVSAGKDIKASGRKESEESVAAMEKRGLKVTKISPDVEAEWQRAAKAAYPIIRGSIVPKDVFDLTLRLIEEFRSANVSGATSMYDNSNDPGR